MDNFKNIIEALIFSTERPLTIEQIKEVLGNIETEEIRRCISQLQAELSQAESGIQILEVAGGFKMCTNPKFAIFIKNLFKIRHVEKLTGPSLETLAIIAYKQPVTKLDIESLRGVNVDGVIKTLLEKDLVRTAGRKNVIGRPFLYATTQEFLEYFGLKSLRDLPPIEEFVRLSKPPQNVKYALEEAEKSASGQAVSKEATREESEGK